MPQLYSPTEFTNSISTDIAQAIYSCLQANGLRGFISQTQASQLLLHFKLSKQDLYFEMLKFATHYAYPTISNFFVGAIVESIEGDFYFGANMEFEALDIQSTVHAEQSAINHAFASGASGVQSIIVNYSPCGHCRQFINELNTAQSLQIYLPQIPNGQPLSYYLPASFGPSDLKINQRLFDHNSNISYFKDSTLAVVKQQVFSNPNFCYAPYSNSKSIVILETKDSQFFVGRYIENAAFNPSFAAVISALALARLYNQDSSNFKALHLFEQAQSRLQVAQQTQQIAKLYNLEFTQEFL